MPPALQTQMEQRHAALCLCQGHSRPTRFRNEWRSYQISMQANRRERAELPTVLNGKTMPELLDEYVFTEQQVRRTIDYT